MAIAPIGFVPILEVAQLPSIGVVETLSVDFKAKHSSTRLEAAKDVAAFANASGGTILIGACSEGDRLTAYRPLSPTEAQAAKTDYEEAVRDRCSPAPVFDVLFLPRGDGNVVAVNIWPMPGQAVGVELRKRDLTAYEREFEGVYFYPLRVGSQTRAILPEQLPMFIDAKARKTVIVLSRAVGRTLVFSTPNHERNRFLRDDTLTLEAVDVQENSIVVGIEKRKYRVRVPIDLIDAAWFDGSRVYVSVAGYIEEMEGPPEDPELPQTGGYIFVPQPRFLLVDPNAGRRG